MSEKFKKIISILLAYKFEFIVASDNESNMYFAYHNDKNGKTVWKINDEAHVFIAEKTGGVVRYLDPQVASMDASDYFSKGSKGRFGYFRMDDKQLTTDANIISATVEVK